ncbi:hypothetical protein [Antarcticirhabdus aurantiaca]|uniref:Uncharacterized protein n=1 Tax=Antarcticirhabdus aurantiaca TaxID=2606717 RepID=A0ACD4NK46_9HYPH|nr:hypothetical protein [Antarcticirhabdus aurantiaca]WAJ27143.1 hypothetical protein OXU80_20135 [Jeongeuplla avenae]
MAIFDPVWASDDDALITPPTADEIEEGFRCGRADPGLFNWLIQTLQSTINALNIGDMASKFRQVATTEGIQGGGDLQDDRTLRLNFSGLEVENSVAGDDIVAFFDISAGAHRKTTRTAFLAGVGGAGGSITGGENIGTGTGLVYASVNGGSLQFRRLKNAGGIDIAVSTNDVVLSIAPMGAELTVA